MGPLLRRRRLIPPRGVLTGTNGFDAARVVGRSRLEENRVGERSQRDGCMASSLPRVIAAGPAGLADPGPVVAALRAGALGVIDLGLAFRTGAAIESSESVARFT